MAKKISNIKTTLNKKNKSRAHFNAERAGRAQGAKKQGKNGKKSFAAAAFAQPCSKVYAQKAVSAVREKDKEGWGKFLAVLADSAGVNEAIKESGMPAMEIYCMLKKANCKKTFEEIIAVKIEHAAFDCALKGNATLSAMFLSALMPDKYKGKTAAEQIAPPKIVFVDSGENKA